MDQASDGRGGKNAPGSSAGALKEAASEDRLLPLVEAEIIPRLMMAHQDQRLQAPMRLQSRPATWLVLPER